MTNVSNPDALRRWLIADAALSGAAAMLVLIGGGTLAEPLGLPEGLLRGGGLVLLPYVCFVLWTGARRAIPETAVWAIIAANAAWALASVVLLFTGWVAPTLLGHLFVIAQALAVAVMGEFQYLGLRWTAVGASR